ncbi:MAG: FKBP-type peptidyl-prolyl cis-trans isomerase [Armatimonadetes bacterium]|nr:FKBP-type peptidyl-prolyl cis-trans isomerase [Armatimonadota bacterium]
MNRWLLFTCFAALAAAGCNGQNKAAALEAEKDVPVDITIIEEGTGEGAEEGDVLWLEYSGAVKENGLVFDANDEVDENGMKTKLPFRFVVGAGAAIQGWEEGLVGMKLGEVRTMLVPWQKAYGTAGRPEAMIPAKADLSFKITLFEMVKVGEDIYLDKTDLVIGTGPAVEKGDAVTIHYTCEYANGKLFDSSYLRGENGTPLVVRQVQTGQLISGVDYGLVGMKAGGKRLLRIPPKLAFDSYGYGEYAGNQIVMVVIEVLEVKKAAD